jgi:hypothetical protein
VRSAFQRFFLVAAVIGLAGCAQAKKADKVPVTTKVVFANGQPVKDVLCCFVPHTAYQLPAEFPLDANGNVSKNHNGVEPIIHPGKYTVYFQPIERGMTGDRSRYATAFKLIPTKYAQQVGSGLEIEVEQSGGPVTIQLES